MKFSKKLVALTLLALSVLGMETARADLKSEFTQINKTYKGPFGLNVLQGPYGRAEIRGGGHVREKQFQAAFRNEGARKLATDYGFYLGNLFTTNYYELTGEYVYGNAYGSHKLDHARLTAAAANAIGKASNMVRHWVLEKHYVAQFPKSEIAKGFTLRGVADSANETEYANYFFSFYVTATNDEIAYLPAFILVNRSPIVDSNSLGRARDLVSSAYEYYSQGWGADPAALDAMYKLRNAIHNQLNKTVISQIDEFLRQYPEYRQDGYFAEIRQILVNYYAISPAKISALAKTLGMIDVKDAADRLTKKPSDVGALLQLSRVAAEWRASLGTRLSFDKRGKGLALLADTARILNKELSELSSGTVKSAKVVEAVLNTVYLEGFIIKDNLEYFRKETETSQNLAGLLADVLDAATETLGEAFKPALAQWVSLEAKMQGFTDNTIKASALNTVSVTIEKLKK